MPLRCGMGSRISPLDAHGLSFRRCVVHSARSFCLAIALVLGLAFEPASAAPLNAGFESGSLTPWVLTGAGATVSNDNFTPAIAAPGGRFMAYITTLNNEGAHDFGYYNDSPDIDGNGVKESEYSALSITFTTAAPSTVCVRLNFLTDEVIPGSPGSVNDSDVWGIATGSVQSGPFAFLAAVGSASGSTAQQLAPSHFTGGEIVENAPRLPTLPDASRFQGQTGFSNFCFQVPAGAHTWTFFVADSRTDGVASAMLIDEFTVTPTSTPSESVVMVSDINPGWRGSYPSFLTAYRNDLYFRANTGLNDTELWRFDGTNAVRVADIAPGETGSSPANLAVLGDRLFFNASTTAGYRVWSFDGTNAARVTNANPPYAFFDGSFWKPTVWFGELAYPSQGRIYLFNGVRFAYLNTPPWAQMDLVLWNGALYYGAQEGTHGVELWRFNGTSQTRVTDIHQGDADASPEGLYVAGSSLYFRARTAALGRELYCFDGTTARCVADINPGAGDSNPGEFCFFAGHVYFSADDGIHGYELWRTDGTNVAVVADINPNPVYQQGGDPLSDSYPRRLTVWRNKLYFAANNGSGAGLWNYDGTNVSLVGGGTANADGNANEVSELFVFRDQLYFDADDGYHGRELWRVEPSPTPQMSIAANGPAVNVKLNEALTGSYVIETTTDLNQWTALATNSSLDGRVWLLDTNSASSPTRFYRARPARQ
jgi:ELWxxDGT repeat protein